MTRCHKAGLARPSNPCPHNARPANSKVGYLAAPPSDKKDAILGLLNEKIPVFYNGPAK